MRLARFDDWCDLLESYPMDALWRMSRRIGLSYGPRSRKGDILEAIARAQLDGRAVRKRFEACDDRQRLVLRLGLDADDVGMPGGALAEEAGQMGERDAHGVIRELLSAGLLLVNTELRPGWGGVADALGGGDEWKRWRFIVHPTVRKKLAAEAVPGETPTWSALARPVKGAVSVSHAGSFVTTIHALQEAVAFIDAVPAPFTKAGHLRANAEKRLERTALPATDTLGIGSWLRLAEELGLVVDDPRADRYLRLPGAHQLVTEPLNVLARLLAAVVQSDVALISLKNAPWATTPGGLRFGLGYGYGFGGLGVPMGTTLLTALSDACGAFLDPGVWFRDFELLPPMHAQARSWLSALKADDSNFWTWRTLDVGQIRTAATGFVTHCLDVLAILGFVDRGRPKTGNEPVARLTRLGAWLFHPSAAVAPPRPQRPLLRGLRWTHDGSRVIPKDPADAALLGLFFGTLARPSDDGPAAGFTVDKQTIAATLLAGGSAEDVERRLRALGQDPLAPGTAATLAAAAARHQPVVVHDDIAAVEVPDIEPTELQALADAGYTVIDDPFPLILVRTSRTGPLLRRLGVRLASGIDYDARPRAACRLDGASLVLTTPRASRGDLRLVRAVEDLGVPVPVPGKATLSFDAIPGTADLDDKGLEQHLNTLLRRLEPHVDGPIPDGVRLQLLADGGLVDAPEAEKALLLAFPEAVARGLVERGALGPQAEALPGGRFVIPAAAIPDVEARLSDLGIPFPAEHSSLRERAQARVAVAQLQNAVSGFDEALPTPTRAPAPARAPALESAPAKPKPPAKPPQPTAPPVALGGAPDERVARAVAAACEDGGLGLRLGEIADALDLDKKDAKTLLRRMVEEGRVVLRGHARGARYTVS